MPAGGRRQAPRGGGGREPTSWENSIAVSDVCTLECPVTSYDVWLVLLLIGCEA